MIISATISVTIAAGASIPADFEFSIPTVSVNVQVTDCEVGWILIKRAKEMTGVEDDAGCDRFTDEERNTYVQDRGWKVSSNPLVAALVDAANVLFNRKVDPVPRKADVDKSLIRSTTFGC